ncbi:MAG: glycosyltransferase [Burkholderiales bacterium]|nr:glycosyltransferase [Burkholderiales bacterium]
MSRQGNAAQEPGRTAPAAAPDARAHARQGAAHEKNNEFVEAIACYGSAIAANQHDLNSWARVGYCMMRLFKLKEALDTFDFVLAIDPRHVDAMYGRAACLESLGDHVAALAAADAVVAAAPDNPTVYPFRAYLRATHGRDPAQTLAGFRDWGRRFADPLTRAAPPPGNDPAPGRRLRIGYVSADLRDHAVAYFVLPVFARHDRRRFEVSVFSAGPADRVTARLRAGVDHWHEVGAMNDAQLAGLIRRRGIDVLIDLSGHSMGNRLLAFARRPAPVQATWLGFLYTTGMEAMDYRITDFDVDPPGRNEAAHSETLFRMRSMACYSPPPDAPLALRPPMEAGGRVTFASLNNLKKVTDEVLRLWKRVLDAVPGSILILIGYERTQEEAIAQQRPRLEAAGLPLDRLCILPRLPLDGFMQLGMKADIALDTFPISGGTTTLHSLWMGLPVVALGGGQAFTSSSAATLHGVGCADLIAADPDDYVARAAALARDPERLAAFRASIRPRMQKSIVMDYDGFVRDLEDAYRLMWLNYVLGEKRYLQTGYDVAAAIAECAAPAEAATA